MEPEQEGKTMAAFETQSTSRNRWGGFDYQLTNGDTLRTTEEHGERSLIRLDRNGVHLYSIRFDLGAPAELVADTFLLALRFDTPPMPKCDNAT
jgi:hypothetical protein